MRFAITSVVALASTFSGVLSAPAAAPNAVVVKRANFELNSFISGLSSEIQPAMEDVTNIIKSVTPQSAEADIEDALSKVGAQISTLASELNATVSSVPTLEGDASQEAAEIASALEGANLDDMADAIGNLLFGVSTAADEAIKVFGLNNAIIAFAPISSVGGDIVQAVDSLIPGLEAVLTSVVDILGGGLSRALPGLNL